MTQGKDQDSKENNWKEREEKLENGGDNALDNNNTIDKSKNGNVTPDPTDSHTLYSNGKHEEKFDMGFNTFLLRTVQMDRL